MRPTVGHANADSRDLAAAPPSGQARVLAFYYLRAFIIVLVVLQHSILAYMVSASLDRANPVLGTFLVVDSARWIGFDVMAVFNDIFFMSLMFFISGLFVWPALNRKGPGPFFRDRLVRLGLPFALVVTLLTPLAVYPALLVTHAGGGYLAAWRVMIVTDSWPSGPVWFLWILLALDCVATLVYWGLPRLDVVLKKRCSTIFERPLAFLAILVGASLIAYLPMVLAFGPYRWFGQGLGPFWVQSSRVLLYPTYFFAGVAVGAYGLAPSAFGPDGALARESRWWRVAGIVSFVAALVVLGRSASGLPYGITFVVACAVMGMALVSVFLRHANHASVIWDSLASNSYGIFLVHYPFVIWLQYLLLGAAWSAIVKALVVFGCALALSWCVTVALRRIPVVARVI